MLCGGRLCSTAAAAACCVVYRLSPLYAVRSSLLPEQASRAVLRVSGAVSIAGCDLSCSM